MSFRWLCVVLVAFTVAVARGDEDVDEKYVKVLSDKNFDKNIKKDSMWLVEFYAPWCGHCKSLKPVWADAARTLAAQNSGMKLAKVDATANQALTRRFSISGYPTIKFFKNGKNRGDYPGGRTKEEIIKFANQASGPAVVTIAEGDGMNNFIGSQDISFVLAGVSSGNLPTLKAFEKIAEEETVLGVIGFAVATEKDLKEYLTEEDIKIEIPTPSLIVFNTGEVSFVSPLGANAVKLDQKNMEQFVSENKKQLFPELSPSRSSWKLTKEGRKTVLAFVDQSKDATDPFLQKMRSVMRQLKQKFVFGWVEGPANTYLLDPIGLSIDSLPRFVVVDISEMTYFKAPWATEESEIVAYLERVHAGKEKAFSINEEKDKGKGKEDPGAQAASGGGSGGSGASSAQIQKLEELVQTLSTRVQSVETTLTQLWAAIVVVLGGVAFTAFRSFSSSDQAAKTAKKRA